jgi:uncharacterized delta-60 repeat protein
MTTLGTGTDTNAAALALQPADQKIIVTGHANVNGKVNVVVLRYNTTGSLDTTFAPDLSGIVLTAPTAGDAAGLALALQPDGKILVAGSVAGGAAPFDTLLLRYDTAGNLDKSTFGNGTGFVITPVGGSDFANAVMVQPTDNKIVLAGHANVDQSPSVDTSDFALIRYDASGALDPSFGLPGTPGIVVDNLGAFDNALSAALQSDGMIVVAGNTGSAGSGTRVVVARYAADGSRDSTFGSNGIVSFAPLGPSVIASGNAVVLQGGAIVVAGYD